MGALRTLPPHVGLILEGLHGIPWPASQMNRRHELSKRLVDLYGSNANGVVERWRRAFRILLLEAGAILFEMIATLP